MYSRSNRTDRPIELPKNYGGSAFSRTEEPEGERPPRLPLAPPIYSPPPPKAPPRPCSSEMEPDRRPCDLPPDRAPADRPPVLDAGGGLLSRLFAATHALGKEDWLLLALILLLLSSRGDTETVLLLVLLLFCG